MVENEEKRMLMMLMETRGRGEQFTSQGAQETMDSTLNNWLGGDGRRTASTSRITIQALSPFVVMILIIRCSPIR